MPQKIGERVPERDLPDIDDGLTLKRLQNMTAPHSCKREPPVEISLGRGWESLGGALATEIMR